MTGHDKAIVNRICAFSALLAGIVSALAVFASEPWSATALFTAAGGGMCVAVVAFIAQRAKLFVFAQIVRPAIARVGKGGRPAPWSG